MAHGRGHLEEEMTTEMGLWMVESRKDLTWDGTGATEWKA